MYYFIYDFNIIYIFFLHICINNYNLWFYSFKMISKKILFITQFFDTF